MKIKNKLTLLTVFIVLVLTQWACGGSANNGTNAAGESGPFLPVYGGDAGNNAGDNAGYYGEESYDNSGSYANENSANNSAEYQFEGVTGGAEANKESLEDTFSEAPNASSGRSPDLHDPPPHATHSPSERGGYPPQDTFFQDYGVNPFVFADRDNLSTFALDVDTGSYTITRSYINDHYLPPTAAVRTEEFINYFPQGYTMPREDEVFSINIDGGPSPFTEYEWNDMLRIGIQGYDVPRSERKDVSLTFVIDVSGSMGNGNRLELVKEALYLLVDQLHGDDLVSIVAYTDTAWVELEPTRGSESRTIKDAIRRLYPMNSTNAEAGLILGYDLASHNFLSNGINRVILASDGVANVGETGPDSIWESIKYYASEGITLTAVGVGMGNYNDVLLEQLADNGEGFYAYIDTMDEAKRLFTEDLVGTLQVIAMDAKIQVDFNPEVVRAYRLVGFENRAIADEDFTNDQIDAAEFGAGHTATALYEIELYEGARGQIATVYLRWQDPDTLKIHETTKQFFTDELGISFRNADPYFQSTVLVAEFAEILRDSYWASDNGFENLAEYSSRALRLMEEAEFYELNQLIEEAVWLDSYSR